MAKYFITILFTLALGLIGGYAIGSQRTREEMKKAVDAQERSLLLGVLYNDSDVFSFLAEHLHQQGTLKDDPKTVEILKIALDGIVNLDEATREIQKQGKPVILTLDDSRNRAQHALDVLRTYPAIQQIGEQAGTGQPATRPESKSEGVDKPQPESEGRSR